MPLSIHANAARLHACSCLHYEPVECCSSTVSHLCSHAWCTNAGPYYNSALCYLMLEADRASVRAGPQLSVLQHRNRSAQVGCDSPRQ
eukprot:6212820-Pleurochrysis_carterae.AAC.3